MDPSQIFSYLFAVGFDVLNLATDATTSVILAQTGDAIRGVVDSSADEWWQHVGFASKPSPATAGSSGCQGVAIRRANGNVIIASRDTRAANAAGNLKDGETCLYATGKTGTGQAKVALKQDGSVTSYTTQGNVPGGAAVYSSVTPDGFIWAGPFGKMTLDANGFHLVLASGQRVDLGGMGGLPGGLGGYFRVVAATARLDAPGVFLGSSKSPLGYQPAAYGLAGNPLTLPGVPIMAIPFSPIGLQCANGVFIAGP